VRGPRTWRCSTAETGGFHLLSHVGDCDILVMIDATLDGRPPARCPSSSRATPATFEALSAHDIGLKDLVDSAAILG